MKQVYIVIQGTVAAFIAWLSAKMGILLPVMGVLMGMMVMDYITGMLASKREALDHPDDPTYGWCSRRGAEGIIKKVGYLCVIAVAMVVDYLILRVAAEAGFEVATKAFFGLLVAVWYVLNELLSINKQRFELTFFTNIFRPPIRPPFPSCTQQVTRKSGHPSGH